MTEGNCFLLGELVRAVDAEGWEPTAANAPRIGTLAPDAVLRAVAVRLMRLSDDAAGVARAVAILGDDAQLRHVAALTGRDADRVAAAGDALAAGEILRPPGRGVLRFAHPLLASAVYADVGSGERASLHRRAAEILRDEDISAGRVAAHLLPSAGSGEDWVVDVLCAAAARARAGGEPESAASYLRRALDEPPAAAARAGVLRALARCEISTDLPAGDRPPRGGAVSRRRASAIAPTRCSSSVARGPATPSTRWRSRPSNGRQAMATPTPRSPRRRASRPSRSGCSTPPAANACCAAGARPPRPDAAAVRAAPRAGDAQPARGDGRRFPRGRAGAGAARAGRRRAVHRPRRRQRAREHLDGAARLRRAGLE